MCHARRRLDPARTLSRWCAGPHSGRRAHNYARESRVRRLGPDPQGGGYGDRSAAAPAGICGSLTILKDHLRQVRPGFLAAASYQRTSYLLASSRRRSTGGTAGCLQRLGGLPGAIVSDNDAAIVASRRGGTVRLVAEVAALYGGLGLRPVVLRPRFPEGKGQVERAIGYLESSFVPLRRVGDLADLQAQADAWTVQVADQRHVRQLGARVADALVVERAALRRLPERLVRHRPAPGGTRQPRRLRAGGWGRLLGATPPCRPSLARETSGGQLWVKAARLPAVKTLDDFDFTFQRSLRKQVIAHLAQLDFLLEAHNVVFLGPPGTGKTHLSIALAVQAARRGHRVAFATAHQWVQRLDTPNGPGGWTASWSGCGASRCWSATRSATSPSPPRPPPYSSPWCPAATSGPA